MKVSIIGTGYVGLVSGVCLAEIGHTINCIDIDKSKIENLNKDIIPFYEPNLEELIKKNKQKITFSSEFNNIEDSEIIIIAVGTPTKEDGDLDLKYIYNAAEEIAKNIKKEKTYKVIVIKSTVPPNTNENIKNKIKEINPNLNFNICSNPEFLREGSAIKDFMEPDRIVVGTETEKACNKMKEMYQYFIDKKYPFVNLELKSAELVKYVSNAYLAMRISFANETATICEKLNLNPLKLLNAIGLDSRIGTNFFHPGPGYGGSCFPKDVQGLEHFVNKTKIEGLEIINSIHQSNQNRMNFTLNRILEEINKNNYTKISILGLAFKGNTDDIRESPAIFIIKNLPKEIEISTYDPEAINNTKKELKDNKNIKYCNSIKDCCKDNKLIIIATEWEEFKSLNFKDKKILDLRYLIS